jgi:phage terminase large subunit
MTQKDLAHRITEWRRDPVLFVKDVLRVENVETWQEEGLCALVNNDRLAVRSGHGVGKTAWLAWIILWWLLTRSPAKIGVTAPSAGQLEDALWPEIRYWHSRMPTAFQELIEITASRVEVRGANDKAVSFATAKTARPENPDALAGLHSKHMLFVIDESAGVAEAVFETALGVMSTAGAKTVMTGNPTRVRGYFFDAFHLLSNRWWTRRVSCLESTRVTDNYAGDIAAKYGEDSNVYRVRVLGDFPTSDEDSIIPLGLVEEAQERDIEVASVEDIVWGVDPARFGSDRTAFCKRSPTRMLEPVKYWQGKDIMETAGIIKHEWDTCHGWERPAAICVDVIGLGAGVHDRLKEMGLPSQGVNVAEMPSQKELYLRLRDELWFKARNWFQERACWLPDDPELVSELVSVRFKIRSSGKIDVESKEEMKRRSMRSPDLADAFCLTFANVKQSPERRSNIPRVTNNSYSPHRWRG